MKKILFIILFLSSLFAKAQMDTSVSLYEVQITSVRSKNNQPIVQSTILTKDLMKSYQGQDIPAILNFSSPSITFTSDAGDWSGYMYYRLRGIDQTRINSTLNGMPLNEPEDQGAYFSNYQDFFANVSSIQIQRGVGTSSNGTSSYAGSINFQSASLNDSQYTKLEMGKSLNASRYSVAVNTGLKNGFGTYIRYSNISSSGYRNHSGTLGNTIFMSTGYQDSKNILKYTMFYGTSRNQMAWMPTDEKQLDTLGRKHNPLTKDENDFFTQNMNILSYSRFVNKHISFNTSAFYNILDGNYDVNINDNIDTTQDTIFNYKLHSNFYGVSANLNYVYSKVDMSMGISQNYYDRRHMMGVKPYDISTLSHDNIGRKNQTAVFYKLNYNLTHNLSIYTDLQYRFVKYKYINIDTTCVVNNNFFNPKFGANYTIGNSRIFTYIGVSNREPTRSDMFNYYINDDNRYTYDPDNLTTDLIRLYGFNNVKPEKVYDYELGYDYNIKHHKISVNYFYMFFENGLLPVGQLNVLGLPINKNIKYSYRTGLEADYTCAVNNFKFYLGGTLMTSKILSGDNSIINKQMLLTPNLVINSNLSYNYRKFGIMMLNKYVGRSYLTNTNSPDYLKEYLVTNLNLSYTIKNLRIGFNINNIFNQYYYNSGQVSVINDVRYRQYFVAVPRNYFVNLNYTF